MKRVISAFFVLVDSFRRFWKKLVQWRHYLVQTSLLALLFFSARVTFFFNNWRQLENTLSLFAATHQFSPFSLLIDLLGGGAFVLSLTLVIVIWFFCISEYRRMHPPRIQEAVITTKEFGQQRLALFSDLLAEVWWFLGLGAIAHLLSTEITASFLKDFHRFASWKDAVATFYFNDQGDLWFCLIMATIVFFFLFFTESRRIRLNNQLKKEHLISIK
ncbi:hypothetical protein [Candidatus Enterococcus leclercqii]|uniref:hypothetical protein n=1 Tax=Candidatus Enterococcus leclercqii TaxID=1857218 RepID=UPI001379F59A|nr:hypothetical protein [Enterococcus sp. CU9D]KAF1292235.1 hypothetical protein BAU14_06825 [Enterococcus sp. CU9D]